MLFGVIIDPTRKPPDVAAFDEPTENHTDDAGVGQIRQVGRREDPPLAMASDSLKYLVCNGLTHFIARTYVEKRYLFFQHIVMAVGLPIGVARVRL